MDDFVSLEIFMHQGCRVQRKQIHSNALVDATLRVVTVTRYCSSQSSPTASFPLYRVLSLPVVLTWNHQCGTKTTCTTVTKPRIFPNHAQIINWISNINNCIPLVPPFRPLCDPGSVPPSLITAMAF